MKTINLFIFMIISIIGYGQTAYSNKITVFSYDEQMQLLIDEGEKLEFTEFIFSPDGTYFIHKTPTLTSKYTVIAKDDRYNPVIYTVKSNAGNVYLFSMTDYEFNFLTYNSDGVALIISWKIYHWK